MEKQSYAFSHLPWTGMITHIKFLAKGTLRYTIFGYGYSKGDLLAMQWFPRCGGGIITLDNGKPIAISPKWEAAYLQPPPPALFTGKIWESWSLFYFTYMLQVEITFRLKFFSLDFLT